MFYIFTITKHTLRLQNVKLCYLVAYSFNLSLNLNIYPMCWFCSRHLAFYNGDWGTEASVVEFFIYELRFWRYELLDGDKITFTCWILDKSGIFLKFGIEIISETSKYQESINSRFHRNRNLNNPIVVQYIGTAISMLLTV